MQLTFIAALSVVSDFKSLALDISASVALLFLIFMFNFFPKIESRSGRIVAGTVTGLITLLAAAIARHEREWFFAGLIIIGVPFALVTHTLKEDKKRKERLECEATWHTVQVHAVSEDGSVYHRCKCGEDAEPGSDWQFCRVCIKQHEMAKAVFDELRRGEK